MEKKKLLYLLDTDDMEIINKFKEGLKEGIAVIPKACCEIWEIDEKNNQRRIY